MIGNPARVRSFLASALLTAAVAPLVAPSAQAQERPDAQFLGAKLLKTDGAGELDWSVSLPASCPDCRLVPGEITTAQNARELYFHFTAPSGQVRIGEVVVRVDPRRIRKVIVARRAVPFRKIAGGIAFTMEAYPPPDEWRGTIGQVADYNSFLLTPGVRLRVEHADIVRRRGPYASGRWPAIERQAALNLEFAAREAVVALGIDYALETRGLGVVQLMGFDTNYPTLAADRAHGDHPPHWHMHVYWTHGPRARVIPHFYIGADGLLGQAKVYRTAGLPSREAEGEYLRGKPIAVLTPEGESLFSQTITEQGWFALSTGAATCLFEPVGTAPGDGGFAKGVRLACPNLPVRVVEASDDIAHGEMRLMINGTLVERHRYDPDTGEIVASDVRAR